MLIVVWQCFSRKFPARAISKSLLPWSVTQLVKPVQPGTWGPPLRVRWIVAPRQMKWVCYKKGKKASRSLGILKMAICYGKSSSDTTCKGRKPFYRRPFAVQTISNLKAHSSRLRRPMSYDMKLFARLWSMKINPWIMLDPDIMSVLRCMRNKTSWLLVNQAKAQGRPSSLEWHYITAAFQLLFEHVLALLV